MERKSVRWLRSASLRPLVYRQPRVAILSSGDELLAIDQPLLPGHIRESNSYALDQFGRRIWRHPDTIPARSR